jgi:hypothetical protein
VQLPAHLWGTTSCHHNCFSLSRPPGAALSFAVSPKPPASRAIPIPIPPQPPTSDASSRTPPDALEEPSTSGRQEPCSPPQGHFRHTTRESPVHRRAAMSLSPLGPRSPLLAAVTSHSPTVTGVIRSKREPPHRSPPYTFPTNAAGRPPVVPVDGRASARKALLFSDPEDEASSWENASSRCWSNSLPHSHGSKVSVSPSKLVARHLDPSPVEGSPLREQVARVGSAHLFRGGITPPQGGSWSELERTASLPPQGSRPGKAL